jgi:hypothetical protein
MMMVMDTQGGGGQGCVVGNPHAQRLATKNKTHGFNAFFALATSAASRAVSCKVTEMRVRDSAVCYRNVLPQWRFEIVEAASWKREETRGSIEVLV